METKAVSVLLLCCALAGFVFAENEAADLVTTVQNIADTQTVSVAEKNQVLNSFFDSMGMWKGRDEAPPAAAQATPDRELVRALATVVRNVELNKDQLEKDAIISLFKDFVRKAAADQPAAAPAANASAAPAPARDGAQPAANVPASAVIDDVVNLNSDGTADLEGVINMIRTTAGVNVVTDTDAIRRGVANGSVRTTITLKVDNMSLKNALNWITRLTGLTWTLKDEAVFITTPDRIGGNDFKLRVYDIRDTLAPTGDFPAPPVAFGKSDDPIGWY